MSEKESVGTRFGRIYIDMLAVGVTPSDAQVIISCVFEIRSNENARNITMDELLGKLVKKDEKDDGKEEGGA